jgi:LPS-assembly protein
MVRPGTFVLAAVALGGIMPAARADEPPCPSQNPPPAAPAPATAAAAQAGKAAAAARGSGNIEIKADSADVSVEGKGSLKGDVVVRQGDVELRAGEMQIDKPNQFVKSAGSIEYRDPLVHVTGAGGSYSAATGAEFQGAHFDLSQRAARGAADTLALTPDGVLHLKNVIFTTCPAAREAWELKASSITLDTRDQIGTGRNASVDFLGVPLIYLPWVSFPLSSDRKSGFLFPSVGSTSNNGFQLAVPYYWNIAPNADFTFQPIEYTKRGADLGGDLRFLTADQHGELQWDYLPNDTLYGGSRNRLQLDDVVQLPADLRLTVDAQAVSDVLYFQDFAQTPAGTSTSFLNRSATLSYRDQHWSVDAEAQQYQTIDTTVLVDERPYARVPRLAVDSDYTLWGVVHYGFQSELVDFQHAPSMSELSLLSPSPPLPLPPLPSGWREDLTPGLSLSLAGPGYFFRPAFAWRATWYQLTDTLPGTPTSLSRNLPIASLDSGLVFERESGSHDQRTLTLEPRLQYLYVPYRDQSALPVFDTGLPDLNAVELFRTNRYVGADRVSDANQLTAGLTSRLLDTQTGKQFLTATIGQSYYFTPPRVTLPGETPFTAPHSDFVAQLAITAFADWNADAGVEWDPDNQRSERTQLNLQYKPAPDAVVNLSYRYERFVQVPEFVQAVQLPCVTAAIQPGIATGCDLQGFDQVDASAAWPIRRSWSVFAREVFDLRNHEELEGFAGFEYRACCWRLRLGARRYVSTFTGSRDSGIWLQLELAGLAGVGSATDTSLSEEIRGYTAAETSAQKIKAP